MKRLGKSDRAACSATLAGIDCTRPALVYVGPPGKPMPWCASHAMAAQAAIVRLERRSQRPFFVGPWSSKLRR